MEVDSVTVLFKQIIKRSRHDPMDSDDTDEGEFGNSVRCLTVVNDYNPVNYQTLSTHIYSCYTNAYAIPVEESGRLPNLDTFLDLENALRQGLTARVKQILRENSWPINSPVRAKLWPQLCAQHRNKDSYINNMLANNIDLDNKLYWETVELVCGELDLNNSPITLPDFVDHRRCPKYYLTHIGVRVVDRIITVISYEDPAITYAPILYPITSILLHYMSEVQTYRCIRTLLYSSNKFFMGTTRMRHELNWRLVMQLACFYSRRTQRRLKNYCGNDIIWRRVFMNWQWWILSGLPFYHLVRVMDCYLHEGIKVFYRVAIAILKLFCKYNNMDESLIAVHSTLCVTKSLIEFCQHLPLTPEELLHEAFHISLFSSSCIKKVQKQIMQLLPKIDITPYKGRFGSCTPFNAPVNGTCNIEPKSWGQLLLVLWSWLPEHITTRKPLLIYSTNRHERSLNSLLLYLDSHETTLFLIRTPDDYLFGAYCSVSWKRRLILRMNEEECQFFGTGETFLFTLHPKCIKYPWIGLKKDHSADNETEDDDLFMYANEETLIIGGGVKDGAILFDKSLITGRTTQTKTFNNPPLYNNTEFNIQNLEVYCFYK